MDGELGVGMVLGGRYQIVGLVGHGGMGTVWVAQHLRLPGKRVAVKVLRADAASDPSSYARFCREAEVTSRLGHPNIVEVLDFDTLPDGKPYLVLEYLQGESLAARLRRGPLPLDAALSVARQIGSALQAAHRAGVVHRDLKPDNVFLCPSDAGGVLGEQVKVLDFGISKIRDGQAAPTLLRTQDATLLGTPQYMAPEQAQGRHGEVDHRTDQFALAAIVYEMLSGAPAFAGATLAEVVCKVVLEEPPPLGGRVPSIPPRVTAAVERGLRKRAEERFSDVSELIAALTGAPLVSLEGRAAAPTTEALAPTAPGVDSLAPTLAATTEKEALPRGRRRGIAGRGLVLVAGALAAVGAVVFYPRSTDRGSVLIPPPPTATVAVPPPAVAPRAPVETPPPSPPAAPVEVPRPSPPATAGPAAGAAGKVAARPESISSEAAADLEDAERALASGQANEAIRLARRSLQVQKTSRAFSVVARAFCREGDVGNARAQLPHVQGADRSRTLKECRAAGIDLGPAARGGAD